MNTLGIVNTTNFFHGSIPFIKYATDVIIIMGIVMSLCSTTVAVYSFVKKKQSARDIIRYLMATLGIGTLTSISGILLNFILHLEIDFTGYKYIIPAGYITGLLTFAMLAKVLNKYIKSKENTDINNYTGKEE